MASYSTAAQAFNIQDAQRYYHLLTGGHPPDVPLPDGRVLCVASDAPGGGDFRTVTAPTIREAVQRGREWAREGRDVWACPALLSGDRKRENVAAVFELHADIDRPVPEDQRADLSNRGFMLVESGSPGHLHVYWRLLAPIDAATALALNRRLRARLAGDSKEGPESLLRLPGVANHKPAAGMVTIVAEGTASTPDALAAMLDTEGVPAAEDITSAARVADADAAAFAVKLYQRADDEPCSRMQDAAADQAARLHAAPERHPNALRAQTALGRLAAEGHPGLNTAIALLCEVWGERTAGEDRAGDFARMLDGMPADVLGERTVDQGGNVAAASVVADRCVCEQDAAITARKQGTVAETGNAGQGSNAGQHSTDPLRANEVPVEPVSFLNPMEYFEKETGLRVQYLAQEVLRIGPLAVGPDRWTWAFAGGVWTPAPHVIRDRTARLLGDRYRNSHVTNVEGMIHAHATRITCAAAPEWINFRNGLLDWRTGVLHEHSPEIRSTVQLTIAWDPAAQCPEFERYLAAWVAPDVVPVVWELLGYLLYSGNPLEKAIMLTGAGRNGKGVLLHLVEAILGEQNYTASPLDRLVGNRFATASLFGKIANIAGDIDPKYIESTGIFKAMTGGDTIEGERKGQHPFRFKPWAVPVFSANTIPASADATTGYLSRWVVIPFPNSFAGREDRTLETRLRAELPGIAAKAIRALPALIDRGNFECPPSMLAAKAEFETAVDQVREWADERAEFGNHLPHQDRTVLYAAYRAWAEAAGHRPVRAKAFRERLAAIGKDRGINVIDPHTVNGNRGVKGVRLLPTAPPPTTGSPVGVQYVPVPPQPPIGQPGPPA